ncbi:glycerate kinase [Alkalihalobacillus hwajinpoensis]|uniref:glycerate kinase family protein n=1 Tax=Guptibacillus hwajinpoensis TaxID=208199 RepID=UPI001884388C|nr:glycerate kinase [Pseudalkalibacillus hwajinpoensis]MBF0705787.1 glycerate kinase [Pseudalkalibacillus hwajinpoensis]
MNVLIAMDSFKGSLSSKDAGEAVKFGIKRVFPDSVVDVIPVADGGEGSLEAIQTLPGHFVMVPIHQLDGKKRSARYYRTEQAAYIESAEAVGLHLISSDNLEPSRLTSYGVGELIQDAEEKGAKDIYVFLGGTGTTDGGLGMLQALGYTCFDHSCEELPLHQNPLLDTASIRESSSQLNANLYIVTDVDNPYAGQRGAAAVFGPQKGMKKEEIPTYDAALHRVADLLSLPPSQKGAGAAGGIGGSLYSLGATYVPGIEWMLELLKVEEKLAVADIAFTGEGQMDDQTAYGKVPSGVGKLAKKHNIPCFALAGQVVELVDNLYETLSGVLSIQQGCHSLEHALNPDVTKSQLAFSAEQVMRIWSSGRGN